MVTRIVEESIRPFLLLSDKPVAAEDIMDLFLSVGRVVHTTSPQL